MGMPNTGVTEEGRAHVEPRPWRRYFARAIDTVIAIALALLFLLLVRPDYIVDDPEGTGIAIFALFCWIFVEAILLSAYGATPGKAILATSVQASTGRNPRLAQALSRSVRVWFFGLGLGFPIITFVTMLAGYIRLSKNGVTSWDEATALTVVHRPLKAPQIAVAVALVTAMILLLAMFRAAAGS